MGRNASFRGYAIVAVSLVAARAAWSVARGCADHHDDVELGARQAIC